MELLFEWSEEKALLNFEKHGVRFEEAKTSFEDEKSITFDDLKHSEYERRYLLIGQCSDKKLLTIVHTLRADSIRLISARLANKKERNIYEGKKK